jgi:hypothetical protein
MNDKHPITPPPELVKQWWKDAQQANYSDGLPCWLNYIATQAARWGADQELEACCEWFANDAVSEVVSVVAELRAARRPQPPSLKEQALALLDTAQESDDACNSWNFDTIRCALEALPE